ncbi:hypothetical protein NDA11_000964 [Ustilago hordei]|uniref:Retroviral polymerase SH3-like domain-containing protein n=1 Tax=Ustilago hordei TaxID=120017 RepID=I2FM18_USTHO|nr:hypothetical protein NDA10_002715 [Ustilago hordei]KAJ1570552.1 hypothetical protein NDA11_000964 [Ustilago hordei]KAJ1587535.1 hypothetical protein NDA15_006451 [Ustilago hordei]KAJ1589995.1 hypothetical protein NDA12_002883 [Ustilago hordei]UTT96542.1 hypothetical protein NDA17_000302 [Ustilago hordei]
MNLTPSVDNEFPYQIMFGRLPQHFMHLIRVFRCLTWVNISKAKRDNQKLDQRSIPAVFIGYSLERKGWLFYNPNYKLNDFWSNSAKFLEDKRWSDCTEWWPIGMQPPQTLKDERSFDNLGYTEENLFDEQDQEALDKWFGMDPATEPDANDHSREDLEGRTSKARPRKKLWKTQPTPLSDSRPWTSKRRRT